MVKDFLAKLIFVLMDILFIFSSLALAYALRNIFADTLGGVDSYSLSNYTTFYPLYISSSLSLGWFLPGTISQ